MKKISFKTKAGFTIIETMIAVSLFIIIVMMGMGALLNANALHQKSQNMRSILDNLSFVMEDMSRNLRTGYNYRCINADTDLLANNIDVPKSSQTGQSCWGMAFDYQNHIPGAHNDKWVYEIVSEVRGSVTVYYIRKSINSGATWVQLTPDEIVIDPTSYFNVVGAEPPPDIKQPFVTIKLIGTINIKGIVTPFSLQTSVSQRQIDI